MAEMGLSNMRILIIATSTPELLKMVAVQKKYNETKIKHPRSKIKCFMLSIRSMPNAFALYCIKVQQHFPNSPLGCCCQASTEDEMKG